MTSFTQPAVRAPADTVPPPVIRGAMLRLRLADIRPSKFNPRQEDSFDKDSQAELAASIAQRGLLQNLVVRPVYRKPGDAAPDHYELQGGERRFRALKALKVDEIDVRVIAADDAESLATQLVENLDRKNLSAIEEAEGFATLQALDPARYTTAAIARMVGKTERFVQQRLAMARNLAPEARALLATGELKVEAARVLAAAPASTQRQLIAEGSRLGWQDIGEMSADEIRHELTNRAVPLDKAAFDVALYDGAWLEEGKTRRFADVETFDALQQAAAKALMTTLRTDWPKASIVKPDSLHSWAWADNKSNLQYGQGRKGTTAAPPFKVAKDKVTAIVWIAGDRSLHHAEGVTKVENLGSTSNHGSTHGSSTPQQKPETPEHAAARKTFSAAVRAAVLKKPDLVKRLVTLALLQVEHEDLDDEDEAAILKALPPALKPFAFKWFFGDVKVLKAMESLKPAALDQAIAALAVARVGWGDWSRQMPPEITAIAGQVGIRFVAPKPEPEKKAEAGPADKAAKRATGKAAAKATTKTPADKKKAVAARKKHQ